MCIFKIELYLVHCFHYKCCKFEVFIQVCLKQVDAIDLTVYGCLDFMSFNRRVYFKCILIEDKKLLIQQ